MDPVTWVGVSDVERSKTPNDPRLHHWWCVPDVMLQPDYSATITDGEDQGYKKFQIVKVPCPAGFFFSSDQLRYIHVNSIYCPGPVWSLHLWHSWHGGRWHYVWPQEELLCDWRWWPALCLHHRPRAWWAPPTPLIIKYALALQCFG